MTQTQSASRPLAGGPEHRLKSIPLAVHMASASCWGRPWRKQSLALPFPRAITFKGLRLPTQALCSWLHMLARAGMLSVRAKPVSAISQPVVPLGDEDAPPRLQDLGFEFAADMVLDFSHLARQSRLDNEQEEELAPSEDEESVSETDAKMPDQAATAVVEQLAALASAASVSPDSVDQVFLQTHAPAETSKPVVVTASQEGAPEMSQVDATSVSEEALSPGQSVAPTVDSEIQARRSRHMAKLFEMFVAKSAEQAEREEASLSAPREVEASESLEPVEPIRADSAGQQVPEEAGISASREISLRENLAPTGPIVESLGEPVIAEVFELPTMDVPDATAVVEPIAEVAVEPAAVGEIKLPEQQALEVPEVAAVTEPIAEAAIEPAVEEVELPEPQALEVPEVAALVEPFAEVAIEPVVEEAKLLEPQTPEVLEVAAVVQLVAEVAVEPAVEETELPEPQAPEVLEVAAVVEPVALAAIEPAVEEIELPEPQAPEVLEVAAVVEPVAEVAIEPAMEEIELPDPQALEVLEVAAVAEPIAEVAVEPAAVEETELPEPQALEVPVAAAVAEPIEEVAIKPAAAEVELSVPEVKAPAESMAELFVGPIAPVPAVVVLERAAIEVEPQALALPTDTRSPDLVMHWQPVESAHQPELLKAGPTTPSLSLSSDQYPEEIDDQESFDPMISSLEDALALLASASDVRESGPRRSHLLAVERAGISASAPLCSSEWSRATTFAEPDDSLATLVARALSAPTTTHSNLEAMALQGILIQKESAMTEIQEIVTDAAHQEQSVPMISAELQEVAATLSVPKLEADPDDVLSDVQNTLNSLAGMAQGLTQQKQAAGRLQDELEEWNNQLQERERLASDKEERLDQLESHLKQAKTNLDRMAAENNRMLTERSEALKQLAQSVDQRDKSTLKRADAMQSEQQRMEELAASLRTRASELDEHESSLKRKSEELAVRLKQLQSAKDKFSAIVKSFNETVQFNSTLSAISKSVAE